jgi:hypothetical protein
VVSLSDEDHQVSDVDNTNPEFGGMFTKESCSSDHFEHDLDTNTNKDTADYMSTVNQGK